MPTLKELMETDLGVDEHVKTAADQSGDQEIDSLAAQLGLDFAKTAEEEEGKGETKPEEKPEEKKEEKEEEEKQGAANMTSSLYDSLFPEDQVLSKTAEEVKVAEYQESLGARSYDYCAERFDRRIEKLAAALTGGATISAPTGDTTAAPHSSDPTPAQQFDNNKSPNKGPIDHTPVITNELPGKNEEKVVGDVEQKKAAIEDAALRKAWILSQLEEAS